MDTSDEFDPDPFNFKPLPRVKKSRHAKRRKVEPRSSPTLRNHTAKKRDFTEGGGGEREREDKEEKKGKDETEASCSKEPQCCDKREDDASNEVEMKSASETVEGDVIDLTNLSNTPVYTFRSLRSIMSGHFRIMTTHYGPI